MRHHPIRAYTLPPVVEMPTGNVLVLPAADPSATQAGDEAKAAGGWVIHDGDGKALKPGFDSRAEALRQMCVLALRRGVSLPLTLHSPDGHKTGDRLA